MIGQQLTQRLENHSKRKNIKCDLEKRTYPVSLKKKKASG